MTPPTPSKSRTSDISPKLLERIKNLDDQESWNEFHELCAPFIFSFAVRRYGLSEEDAKDVVQETLLKVAKHLPGFNSDPAVGSFRGWLRQIVRTQVIERWRHEKKHLENRAFENPSPDGPLLIDRLPDPSTEDIDAVWEREWQRRTLRIAKERVREKIGTRQYLMFEFLVLKEWPAARVAEKFQASLGQVYFARRTVEKLLAEEANWLCRVSEKRIRRRRALEGLRPR